MMLKHCITFLVLGYANIILAQEATFWQKTKTHPASLDGEGNISIATGANDAIFTGTISHGVFRTTDQGNSWEQVLPLSDTAIVKLLGNGPGKLYAIGANTVFVSSDNGNSWERKIVPTTFPVTDIEVMKNGNLIVSTASIVDYAQDAYDFFGDGVFISADGGNTWLQKNNGIGYNKAITQLAISSGNVMVAAMAGYNTNSGGLYYSTDMGQNWLRVNHPVYPGKGDNIPYSPSRIHEVLCMEFTGGDTLYLSYNGIIAGNAGASAGLKISLDNFISGRNWTPVYITPNGYEWLYKPFYSIYHAKKQPHTYASITGGVTLGAAYFKHNNKDTAFRRIRSGITSVNGVFPQMLYTEDSEGRIYAIHHTGYQVYYTDSSKAVSSGVREKNSGDITLNIYPNPASSILNISCNTGNKISKVAIFSAEGKLCLSHEQAAGNTVSLPVESLKQGIYFIQTMTAEGTQQNKILITR